MRALRAMRDAARLDDMAKQAEIDEVEAHGWYTNPSRFAKASSAKCSMDLSYSKEYSSPYAK